MSVYSTLDITRSKAEEFCIEKIPEISNEELSRILDILIEERLYNSFIVPNNTENDDHTL